ncbi:hypothetical protein, variant 2 [Exophiala oligosperma]|uniref:Cytochrome b5 heme-binding domain-containing protein n=1 Tax=Exophiala oligosperma TaxID=215243 RepID=A0A0D2A6I9_9EURO|nr:hypothetical protein, variant 2 [Exophiala oligosperma]KIW35951.1 hypothetical protein, variant 2 [Exophiala oligosperma]
MPAMTTEAMSMSMRKRSDNTASPSTGTAMSDMSAISSTMTSMAIMGSSTASVGTEDRTMSTMADMPQMALGPRGCSPPMMFRPGFNASSLPLETCTNTTSDFFTFTADASRGWTALHLVNAGAVSRLSVSLDGHSMFVYEADGLYVTPQEVQVLHISIGQRYSVMIRLDQNPGDYSFRFAAYPYGDMQQVIEGQAILDLVSPWMLVNGSATSGTVELDDQTLAPFTGNTAPSGAATVTRHFAINQTGIVTWVANREPFAEPARPIIYGSVSDGWNAATTLFTPANATVDIIMKVANDSMDTMGHPMHLHGHKFWFLGAGEGDFPFESVTDAPSSMINLQNPPYRDTIDLPPSGWAVIRYITDNPGAWLFHCHVQWHLVSGMAVVLVENEERMMDMVGSIQNAFNNPATKNSQAEGTSAASTLSGNCPRQYLSFLFSLLLLFVLLQIARVFWIFYISNLLFLYPPSLTENFPPQAGPDHPKRPVSMSLPDPTKPRHHYRELSSSSLRTPSQLDDPKDDHITYEDLGNCDGTHPFKPTLVAIKGIVFDVSRNPAYGPNGPYHVYAGKDPSRALATSSLSPEDCVPEWHDLEDQYKTVLNEWYTFFTNRYKVVGKVVGAHNS